MLITPLDIATLISLAIAVGVLIYAAFTPEPEDDEKVKAILAQVAKYVFLASIALPGLFGTSKILQFVISLYQ